MHVCMLSCFSHVQLCDPMDCSSPGSSVHGDSPGKNTRVGCHALLQRNLLDPGIKLTSLMSSALAGEFFTTSTTWEAHSIFICLCVLGCPSGSVVKKLPAIAGETRDTDSIPGWGRSPRWQPTPVFLPGDSHGHTNLVGCSP